VKNEITYGIIIIFPEILGRTFQQHKEMDKPLTLKENQEVVEGNIELVKAMYNGRVCDLIINEEGLCTGLPYNSLATEYCKALYKDSDEFDKEDVDCIAIMGTAILMIDHDLE